MWGGWSRYGSNGVFTMTTWSTSPWEGEGGGWFLAAWATAAASHWASEWVILVSENPSWKSSCKFHT